MTKITPNDLANNNVDDEPNTGADVIEHNGEQDDNQPGDNTAGGEDSSDQDNVEDDGGDQDGDNGSDDDQDTGADTFPRSYVERLRKENKNYRERAKTADSLAQRLHVELVRADGRLADPADLPFDDNHLNDPEALDAAITELVKSKPGLRARTFTGSAGQGRKTNPRRPAVNLIDLMRQ